AVVRYAAVELGVTHFMVDSLMKCVQGEDDYNGQKAFVDELTAIARDHGLHIHLIHHIKKPANEDHKPSKYDMKGSGAITDQ
ncbi:bifunctional DNA primase/helicase, partial [Klebsiella pneumoniae]|nr:bifunctional DNA primase/helicase [Klebsiella pneumoniae]